MKDLQPMSAAEQTSFCVVLMRRLNIQRKQDYLCDITLLTNDDRELKVHRHVLSASSPFFCKLLESDMKQNREGIIRFKEISGSLMKDVLEFINTGTDRSRELSNHTELENSFMAISRDRNVQLQLHFKVSPR